MTYKLHEKQHLSQSRLLRSSALPANGHHGFESLAHVQAEQIAAAEKIQLPQDFLEAAAGEGLRRSVLEAFVKLQVGRDPHES